MIPRTCPFSSLGSGFLVLLLFLLILVFSFVFCFQSSPSVHVAAKMIPSYFTCIYLIAYTLKRTGSVSFNKNPVTISQRADGFVMDYKSICPDINQSLCPGNARITGQAQTCSHPSNFGWHPHGPHSLRGGRR